MPPEPLTTTVALTATGAWLWDKYGKSLIDQTAGAVKGRWDKFGWKDAAEKYRAKIKKLYGTMQIMGMAEPLPLDDIFTEAYMLDKPTAFGRFDIERLKQASASDPDAPPPNAKRVGGLALVNRNKNLFILGKPGAGKTTFLKYIAVQAAEPNRPVIDKVPIFISLKRWADSGKELMAFLLEGFDICGFPEARPFVEELLKAGGAVVLFDGLDEVNQEGGQRDEQTRQINNFVEKYDRTQCLITCRLAASDYSFKPFTYVEVADFTPKQIEQFVNNWFHGDGDTRDKFLTEFKREDNRGLRDLARTPLLLTLLCLAFNETLTFPQRRVEIYKEALDALLKKWDSSRRIRRDEIYRKLSLGHKENMLARIAAETFERNEYFIPQEELERLITDYVRNVPPHDTDEAADGEVILKAVEAQHGIFVERAREVYSFSHLTFQEYCTAKYVVDNAARGALTNLVREHCAQGRWREVFLLTTSLLSDASQFMFICRRGADELLAGDEKLGALLAWAVKRSNATQSEPWRVRPLYLFVELFPIIRSPKLTSALSFAFDVELAVALNQDLDFRLTLDLAYARNSDIDLERVLDFDRALAHDLGFGELATDLAALSVTYDQTDRVERQVIAGKLRTLMIKHRDIGHEWNLTESEETRLADYLNATRLLRDCLELAFMPPGEKKAMLDSLYLPPSPSVGGRSA